jgi:hypothetical protein
MAPSRFAGPGETSTQADLGEVGWVAFAEEVSHAAGASSTAARTISAVRGNDSRSPGRPGTPRGTWSGD